MTGDTGRNSWAARGVRAASSWKGEAMNKQRRGFIDKVKVRLDDPKDIGAVRVIKQARPYTCVEVFFAGAIGLGFAKMNPNSDNWDPEEGVRIAQERAILDLWKQGVTATQSVRSLPSLSLAHMLREMAHGAPLGLVRG